MLDIQFYMNFLSEHMIVGQFCMYLLTNLNIVKVLEFQSYNFHNSIQYLIYMNYMTNVVLR